jgi:hypothetical protein
MTDLIEELRAAGLLTEGWDDSLPITLEWVMAEFKGLQIKLGNGDELQISEEGFGLAYQRHGTCYASRHLSFKRWQGPEAKTRGDLRYIVRWLQAMADAGLHLGIKGELLRPFRDVNGDCDDAIWV